MSEADDELADAAKRVIRDRYRPGWHVVGAALRLRSGTIVTGVHLEANVGRIAVCAEAVALGRAVSEHGSSDVESIVAVYHAEDGAVRIVAPCGMCREMILDYAPDAIVLMPDGNGGYAPRLIADLLPDKYHREV